MPGVVQETHGKNPSGTFPCAFITRNDEIGLPDALESPQISNAFRT